MSAYLGIDCGSVSVKIALVEGNRVSFRLYQKNTGLISSIQEGLRQLPPADIAGVGVTGSGKEFVRTMLGADYVDSEIIAHMVATLREYPEVRTILDVGGEDSKLMLVRNGTLVNFQMNRDCGGGTGAMIESIASRLGITVEQVGSLALQSTRPATLPGKCGIFCQSAVVSELNRGRHIRDILMGACKALVGNYLAVLGKGKTLQHPIVFQGATAQNRALVRCFEQALGTPVLVPDDCSYMGAIGIAHLTRDHMDGASSSFPGRDAIINSHFDTQVTNCDGCENSCDLLQLYRNSHLAAVSGSRCGKHNTAKET